MSTMPEDAGANVLGTHGSGLEQDEPQIHVSGIFIVLLEVALITENALPILVVISWLPSCARGVGDRLIAALSVTCILSALIPTPLGLASYFSGSWYGGSPTCNTYQVTSIWCNLSALALLCYICVNCHFAVSRLLGFRLEAHPVSDGNHQHQKLLHPTSHTHHNPNAHSLNQMFHSKQETEGDIVDTYCEDLAHPNYTSLHMNGICRENGLCRDNVICPSNDHHGDKSQSVSIQVTDDSQSSDREIPNTFQPDFDAQSNVPVADESLFESSKLEFLAENVQSINNELKERGLTKESGDEDHVNDRSSEFYTNLKSYDEEDKTQCRVSNSTRISSTLHHDDSTLQHTDCYHDDSSSRHYHSLSHENSQAKHCSHGIHLHSDVTITNTLVYENSTYLYTNSLMKNNTSSSLHNNHSTQHQPIQTGTPSPPPRLFQARDYVSLGLFFLYSVTLAISSLPVVGFGPQHDKVEKLCSSWLVPTPQPQRERVFFIAFLTCVYVCLFIGCITAARVGFLVNRRIKHETRRTTRLYHQENIPDIREFSIIDDLKRHYSLTCLAVCGILTWLPIAVMLTLQKSGVRVSEATLVYSNIATSLPCLLNPLLYSLVLARYREGYKAILERCCRKKNPPKSHQMRNVQNCRGHGDVTMNSDIISSSGGHRCVHGRPNPTFESYTGFDIDEDVLGDDDEEIIDDDEDDLDQYFQIGQDEEAKDTLNAKLSEKTPLQTTSHTTSKHGKSSDVRGVGLANKIHWPFPTSQSNDDEVCLITNERDGHENETGV